MIRVPDVPLPVSTAGSSSSPSPRSQPGLGSKEVEMYRGVTEEEEEDLEAWLATELLASAEKDYRPWATPASGDWQRCR